MLNAAPPATYQTSPMNRQNVQISDVPGTQGATGGLSPLSTSASSYMPPSSYMAPSSMATPSSYSQPSSYNMPSNIPSNPNPDPQAQSQIAMIVKALQGGMGNVA